MLLALAIPVALADTILLDTGAAIDGDLARWEFGGDCQISVTEGGLVGAIVIVPCHRVQSFVRTGDRTPVPIGIEEPKPAEEVPLELHAELPAVAEESPDHGPTLPADPLPTAPAAVTAPAVVPPPALQTSGPTELTGASRSVRF
ncbi:MAG: hypothetical protein ACOZNI_26530 [Myxococcota bacterium]